MGDGLYKSTDAGESWTRVGLESSERIGRIAVDPTDSQTVYVCALGHAFDDHADRGVYRTKDGGKTWEKVLYVAPDTGCADLALDPHDPKTILAAMWQFRRRPDFFTSGGPRSGLHRSTDGGATWKPVREGLAAGDLGRIALAPSPAKAGLWYATVESKTTALYRSEDGGVSWKDVNNQGVVIQRPFYFSLLVADPKEAERVYKPGLNLAVSGQGHLHVAGEAGPGPALDPHRGRRALQQKTVMELYALMERLAFLVDGITDLRDQARARTEQVSPNLRKQLTALATALEGQRTALVSSKQGEGISGEQKLREELGVL